MSTNIYNEQMINIIQEKVKDIEYRLSHIIKLPTELDIRLEDAERKVEGLGNNFSKLRSDFRQILAINHSKKPYKCPVCDGEGSIKTRIHPKLAEFEGIPTCLAITCNSCKRKGIVWG